MLSTDTEIQMPEGSALRVESACLWGSTVQHGNYS